MIYRVGAYLIKKFQCIDIKPVLLFSLIILQFLSQILIICSLRLFSSKQEVKQGWF